MKNKAIANAQTLEQGAAWLFISTIIAKIISAAFKIPLSAEYCLGDLGFGYFSSVHDLIGPIHTIAVAGLPVVVSRLIAESISEGNEENAAKVFGVSKRLIGILAAIFGLAILLFSYPFVMLTDETGQTIYSMFAMIPSVCCCIFASVYRGYYEGTRNMVPPAITSIIEALCKLLLGFGLAFMTVRLTKNAALGAAAAVLGIAIGEAASLIFLMVNQRKEGTSLSAKIFAKTEKYDKALAKKIMLLALPITLAAVSGNIVSVVDAVTVRAQLYKTVTEFPEMIEAMFGEAIKDFSNQGAALSAEEIPTFLYGIKSKAFTLYNLVPTIVATLGIAAVPAVTSAFKRRDKAEVKRASASVMTLSGFVALPACFGLFALSEPIFGLLYGGTASSVEIGGKMLSVFCFAALFSALSIVSGSVLQAVDMQNRVFYNVIIGIAVKVILNLALSAVPGVNIYGSVYGTLVCFVIIFILNIISLVQKTKVGKELIMAYLKMLLASAVCAACGYGISSLADGKLITVAAILSAAAVYILLSLLLRAVDFKELSALLRGKKAEI